MTNLIPLDDIDAHPSLNCRGRINPIDVVPLAKGIKADGLLQPIVVREYANGDENPRNKKYQLVAGFRRYTAHVINKSPTIEANIKDVSQKESPFLNLAENLNRKQMNILEEAKTVGKLIEISGLRDRKALANKLNTSEGWIQVRLMVLNFPPDIQAECAAGLLTIAQIRELNSVKTEDQYEMIRRIKDAALQGKKIKPEQLRKKNKPEKESKRQRTRGEILNMSEHIYDTAGPGFGTRCLAWASGEISSADLYNDIRMQCEAKGKTYEEPKS